MDWITRNVSVTMIRENLEDIPQHPLPPGYSVRWYRPGDSQVWFAVEKAAEQLVKIKHCLAVF